MKKFFILTLLGLAACGKSGSDAVTAVQPPVKSNCINTTLLRTSWAYNNLNGSTPILSDCGGSNAYVTIEGVTAGTNPVNGQVINPIGGLCAGQVGATRAPTFTELYFIIGNTTTPITFVPTNTSGVEYLSTVTDGQVYTIADLGYSCKVSFLGGVPTYH